MSVACNPVVEHAGTWTRVRCIPCGFEAECTADVAVGIAESHLEGSILSLLEHIGRLKMPNGQDSSDYGKPPLWEQVKDLMEELCASKEQIKNLERERAEHQSRISKLRGMLADKAEGA